MSNDRLARRLDPLIRQLEQALTPAHDRIDGAYGYERCPLHQFIEGLDVVDSAGIKPGRFLGVGCGLGINLVVAQQYGWKVSAFDIRPEFIEVARRLLPTADLWVDDAMSFGRYGEFDFVYCYRPFIDDAVEDELERRILDQLAVGAWVHLPHRNWLPIQERGDLHLMGAPIWRRAW